MSISDIIQLCGIIVALAIGIVSIIISVTTVKQNSKMIEESTRPLISVYGESINPSSPMFYIVVKNFGSSPAVITKFDYDFDFMAAYPFNSNRDFLKDLINSSIAPNQSKICHLDYSKINIPVTFTIEYKSSSKTYNDSMTVDLKAGSNMITSKSGSQSGTELKTIAYTLQEMLQKSL